MRKFLYCLNYTTRDMVIGRVNVFYQIPSCWTFYKAKYNILKVMGEFISKYENTSSN